MFILALIYLIVLVVFVLLVHRERRYPDLAVAVLFTIIGIALFWGVLNK